MNDKAVLDLINFLEYLDTEGCVVQWADHPDETHEDVAKRYLAHRDAQTANDLNVNQKITSEPHP